MSGINTSNPTNNPYNLPAQATYNPYAGMNFTPQGGSASNPSESNIGIMDIYKIGKNITKLPNLYNQIFNPMNGALSGGANTTSVVSSGFNPSSYFSNLANGTSPAIQVGNASVINTGNYAPQVWDFNPSMTTYASPTSTPSVGSFGSAVANVGGAIVGNLAFSALDNAFGWGGDREGSSIGGAVGGAAGAFLGGPIGAGIGSFVGSLAGSFFGDDGDWPYARFSSSKGNIDIVDSLDGGPQGDIEALGNSAHNVLMAVVKSTGIKADTLPTMALGVASGRKGSNLGSGFFTTINDNGGFASKTENISKWSSAEEVAADYGLRSLQNADISGTSKSFQDLIMSYDGTNGVEVWGKVSAQYAPTQDYETVQAGLRVGPRGTERGQKWSDFHRDFMTKMQEGAA